MDNDDLSSRFAYLLKPIKDLAQNWEIDIAGLLTDYLHELENTNINLQGADSQSNAESVDFTQAAFIIQNSSNVYSKKVEYLILLVHKVYESVKNRKNKSKRNTENNEGGEDNNSDDDMGDSEQDYMLFAIPEEKNASFVVDKSLLYHANNSAVTCDKITLDIVPFFLNVATTSDKYGEKLYSSNGKLLGLQSDFNMFTSTCRRDNGIYILNSCDDKLIEDEEEEGDVSVGGDVGFDAAPADDYVPMDTIAECMSNEEQELVDPMDNLDVSLNHMNVTANCLDASLEEDQERIRIVSEKRSLRGRKVKLAAKAAKTLHTRYSVVRPEPEKDPFALIDEKDLARFKPNPINTGVCYTLPGKMPKLSKCDRRKCEKRKTFDNNPEEKIEKLNIINFIDKHFFKNSEYLDTAVPVCIEFRDYFLEKLQRYKKLRQQQNRNTIRRNMFGDKQPEEDNFGNDYMQGGEEDDDDADADVDRDAGGSGNVHGSDYGDADLDNLIEDRDFDLPGMAECSENEAYFNVQSNRKETRLVKMVSAWFNEIIPQLKEEETRNKFDIYEYGTAILQTLKRLQPTQEWVPFRVLATGRNAFEIPRILLSALLLANMGNIEIKSLHTEEDASLNIVNEFDVKLLSLTRHRDLIEENFQKE